MAGSGVAAVSKGNFHEAVGFGVSALGAVAECVGDLDEAPAVEHKAHPPAVGEEPPRPVDLAEELGCYHALLLVREKAVVIDGELLCYFFSDFSLREIFSLLTYSRPFLRIENRHKKISPIFFGDFKVLVGSLLSNIAIMGIFFLFFFPILQKKSPAISEGASSALRNRELLAIGVC